MHPYRVLASDPASAIVALEDAEGRCHVGRALVPPPEPGLALRGEAPAVGVVPFRTADADVPVPIVLVLLDCEPKVAVAVASGKFEA